MLTTHLRRGLAKRAILIRVNARFVYGGHLFPSCIYLSAMHPLKLDLLDLVLGRWLCCVDTVGERRDVAHFLYQPNTQTGL